MMSLEVNIAKTVSLNSLNKIHRSLEEIQEEDERQQQIERPYNYHILNSSSSSSRQKSNKRRIQRRASRRNRSARSSILHSSAEESQNLGERSSNPPSKRSDCHSLVERILYTVDELEHTIVVEHQNEYKLHMALEQQTEQIDHLQFSLNNEKMRNQRLVQLIRGGDLASSSEEEAENEFGPCRASKGSSGKISAGYWQSRSSMDAYESISPLLMQQRYDELSMSHKQCQRLLVKKDKQLTLAKCGQEEQQAKCDQVLDEYRILQKRFEELCLKYLRLQSKKNYEIRQLQNVLSYASDCVLSAQEALDADYSDDPNAIEQYDQQFRQNLKLFVKALRLCEWVRKSCNFSGGCSDD